MGRARRLSGRSSSSRDVDRPGQERAVRPDGRDAIKLRVEVGERQLVAVGRVGDESALVGIARVDVVEEQRDGAHQCCTSWARGRVLRHRGVRRAASFHRR